MSNEIIAPINHGALSATATTAAEAGKSGFSGLWKGAVWGAAITVGLLSVAIAGVAAIAGASFLVALPFAALGATALTALSLPFGGGLTTLGAGIGTLFGLVKGTGRGVERVGQEKASANMLSAQIEAYKVQNAPAQTTIYAPSASNDNSFPAQGSPMNQAGSKVNMAQHIDRVASPELATARA